MASNNNNGLDLSVVPQQVKDWYKTVKLRLDSDDENVSLIKFVAMGAAGTIALGTVFMGLYRVVNPSQRAAKNRVKHQRLRLLSRRPQSAGAAAAETPEDSRRAPKSAFEQLSAAYATNHSLVKHTGGCHCGKVRFIAEAPENLECIDSDKNMYTLKGRFPHVALPKSRVMLLTSKENLGVYHFGKKPVGPLHEVFEFQNLFCKHCGVHCFGYNKAKETMHVNTMCLDMDEVRKVSVSFDSDRSSWRVMNPLLYEPSVGSDISAPAQEASAFLSTTAKDQAYQDLNHLGVAAGALQESLSHYNTPVSKPSPLLADVTTPVRPHLPPHSPSSDMHSTSVNLFDKEDSGNIISVAENENADAVAESPLAQLFSVERLRLHLKKHVQDESLSNDDERLNDAAENLSE